MVVIHPSVAVEDVTLFAVAQVELEPTPDQFAQGLVVLEHTGHSILQRSIKPRAIVG